MANTSSTPEIQVAILKRREKRAEASKRRNERAEALKNAGNELFKQQNYAGASDLYTDAIEISGPKPVLMSNLAAAYLKLKLYDAAEWAAGKALQYDPKMTKARYRRALARKGMNHRRAAMIDLEHIAENDESAQVEAWTEISRIHDSYETGEGSDDGYSSEEHAWPTYDDEPLDYFSDSDSSDCLHKGNDIPCRFYNHGGCSRGDQCKYSHAPDKKSVRDELGKNVCLFFLVGNCKFGDARCIYSHSRDHLPERGWWNDEAQVAAAREMAALIEQEKSDQRIFNRFFREQSSRRGFSASFGRDQVSEHLQAHSEHLMAQNVLTRTASRSAHPFPYATTELEVVYDDDDDDSHSVCSSSPYETTGVAVAYDDDDADVFGVFTQPSESSTKPSGSSMQPGKAASTKANRNTSISRPVNRTVLILAFEEVDLFARIHQHLLSALIVKGGVVLASTKELAFPYFDSPDTLAGVLVVDPGIVRKKNRDVLAKLVQYVKDGGYAVIGGSFSSFVTMTELETFFARIWGVPWKRGSYHRSAFSVNPDNELVKMNPSLTSSYSMKALHLSGISRETAVYMPTGDEDDSESPVVSTRIGHGHLSYIGDVNAEEESTNTVLAMLGLLDAPANETAADKGKAKAAEPVASGSNTRGETTTQGTRGSNDTQTPARFLLLLALQDNKRYVTSRAQEYASLRAKIDVVSATTPEQALSLLSSPNLAGVFVADTGVARHVPLTFKLVEYVKEGGVLAVGGLASSQLSTLELFFSFFGLKWKVGSDRSTEFALEKHHETAKKNPSLPQSIRMRGLHLKNIPLDAAVYFVAEGDSDDEFDVDYGEFFVTPRRTDFETAVLRTYVGKGQFGFVGDVDGVPFATKALLALLNLLDPPPDLAKPPSRKFVMVLSFKSSKEIEAEYERFLATLHTKIEVLHGLSNERVADLLGSLDLAGVLVMNAEILDVENGYLLSRLVEYSLHGGTIVLGGLFSQDLAPIEVKQFFQDNWDLPWELGSTTASMAIAANRAHGIMKSRPSFPTSINVEATHIMCVDPAVAIYSANEVRHPSRPKARVFQAPFVYAPVGKGHLGYLGSTGLDKEEKDMLLAMLGLRS